MAYTAIVEMASSQSLLSRVVACAAQEGQTGPLQWAQANIWQLASTSSWVGAWDYAKGVSTINNNPDMGIRSDVVSDQEILTAVQALRAAQNPA